MTNNSFWYEAEWVSKERIQELFNECQCYELLLIGQLHQKTLGYDNHLKKKQRQKLHEPLCTRSQIVVYYNPDGQPVALVHQYKRRDGSLGQSGKPDPKRMFISGKTYATRQSPYENSI
ncbi:hypothetical protein ACFLTB_01025 [Chloroflexota bacterium]